MKKLTNVTIDGNPSTIVFDGDRIARIEEGSAPLEPGDIDGRGLAAVPGLVDIHAHGCLGLDTMDADFAEMAVFRAKNGTTTWLPTSMTAFREDLERVCAAPRDVPGARLPGIHLEGPHIAMSKKGAQNPDCIRMPDIDELRSLRPAAIRVTIAPELPGALEYIRAAADMGVSVTLGHTDATYEQACAGFDAGASSLTHTFNAMPGIHHRKPGPIGAALEKGAYAELICDGFHVAPPIALMLYKAFGPDRVALISDNIRPAGAPEGEYDCGGLKVILKNGEARLPDGTIAGCSVTLWECVRRAVKFGIPFTDAIRMATATPAAAAHLDAGVLAPGRPADVLLVDLSGPLPELRTVVLRGDVFASPRLNPTDWINRRTAAASRRSRERRMRRFADALSAAGLRGARILDAGGTRAFWEEWARLLPPGAVSRIDVVNLPGQVRDLAGRTLEIGGVPVRFVAANLLGGPCPALDARYDVAHCVSVIEHVGDAAAQRAFADALRRLGDRLWVQTPAKEFPLEAHFRLPFFAWWPLPLRAFFNWRFRLGVMPRHRSWPEAVAFCRSTRLLTRRAFARLFPSCSLWTERVLLLPKCYVVSDLEGAPS